MLVLLVLGGVVTQALLPKRNAMLRGETENDWKREREGEVESIKGDK